MNHLHRYLTTKWIIIPQKAYTGIVQPNPKPEHHYLSHRQEWWRCNHAQRYGDKINSLLEDTNTDGISNLTTINKNITYITYFNKLFKKLIKNQKFWTSLFEHHPKIPTLYGLPKIHKPDTPTTHYLQQR